MKNIIEKDGKLWMKCSLAMLPTCKLPIKGDLLLRHIWKNTRNECYSLWQFDEAVTIEDTFQYRTLNSTLNSTFRDVASSFVPQHLYILIDENIKEGEWYLVELFNIEGVSTGFYIEKCITIDGVWVNKLEIDKTRHINNCKKIIATTNPELKITPYEWKVEDENNIRTILPQIPQSFIKDFVKANSKGYDEILVEVEKYNYQHINHNPDGVSVKSSTSEWREKLKLSSNNEINIIIDNVDDWDLIHSRYLDYVVIHNKQIGVVNLIKWLKLNYNLPTKIDK